MEVENLTSYKGTVDTYQGISANLVICFNFALTLQTHETNSIKTTKDCNVYVMVNNLSIILVEITNFNTISLFLSKNDTSVRPYMCK